jgi:hypothetical protein
LPKQEETDTYYSIENKKSIISFKPRIMIFFVMVGMQAPKKTVHDVFMTEPSHKFHKEKCNKKDYEMQPHHSR